VHLAFAHSVYVYPGRSTKNPHGMLDAHAATHAVEVTATMGPERCRAAPAFGRGFVATGEIARPRSWAHPPLARGSEGEAWRRN